MPRSPHIKRRRRLRVQLSLFAAAFAVLLAAPFTQAQDRLELHTVIERTLRGSVSIQESIEATRYRDAELQIFEGAFDLIVGLSAEGERRSQLFSSSEQSLYDVGSAYTGVSRYALTAFRLTRSGLSISPVLRVARQDALTLSAPPIVQTQAALEFSYPILNAGKRSPEYADVSAARHALEASRFDEQHARAASVFRVSAAYWAYLGAFESLNILIESEEKARRFLAETQALVEGGERAASDLDQLRADLADRFAAKIVAEQRLIDRRLNLGIEMGIGAEEAADLPPPSSTFPEVLDVFAEVDLMAIEARSVARRADLAGIESTVDAAADARYARSMEARPRIDLTVSIGYAGRSENRLTLDQHLPPFGQNQVSGTNGSLSLAFSWPTSNQRARGRVARQTAIWRQAQIASDDLIRRIRSGLKAAFTQLHSSISELAKIEEAVNLYTVSVENERKKLQLGMSTQFDMILVEERLRNSLLARVAVRMRYADAIAKLRFEAGTLVTDRLTSGEIANRLLSPMIESE